MILKCKQQTNLRCILGLGSIPGLGYRFFRVMCSIGDNGDKRVPKKI